MFTLSFLWSTRPVSVPFPLVIVSPIGLTCVFLNFPPSCISQAASLCQFVPCTCPGAGALISPFVSLCVRSCVWTLNFASTLWASVAAFQSDTFVLTLICRRYLFFPLCSQHLQTRVNQLISPAFLRALICLDNATQPYCLLSSRSAKSSSISGRAFNAGMSLQLSIVHMVVPQTE